MFTNFRFVPAPLAILAVLGAGMATVLLLAAAAVLALARRPSLARRIFLFGAAVPAAYAVLLFALGAFRRERTLPRGQEKHFCEVDCHIANAILAAREEAGVPAAGSSSRFGHASTKRRFRRGGEIARSRRIRAAPSSWTSKAGGTRPRRPDSPASRRRSGRASRTPRTSSSRSRPARATSGSRSSRRSGRRGSSWATRSGRSGARRSSPCAKGHRRAPRSPQLRAAGGRGRAGERFRELEHVRDRAVDAEPRGRMRVRREHEADRLGALVAAPGLAVR